MNDLIRINEFSRKFEEPKWSEQLKKYVSSSFNKEIGFRTENVPSEIEQAISQDQLRINDNYPFSLGEKALVAGEIGQYSILAVAINGSDDGSRPLIAYRYFWLTNINTPEFDGVGTLLKWWEDKGKPFCEIKPHADYEKELQQHGEDYYQATPIYQKSSEQYQQQTEAYKNQTQKDLDPNQIGEKPCIFPIHKKGVTILPNYWGLHALALQLNNKYKNAPIAWSWNTSVMEKPVNFTLICCADENSCDQQIKWPGLSKIQLIPKENNQEREIDDSQISLIFASNQLKRDLLEYVRNHTKVNAEESFDNFIEALEKSSDSQFGLDQIVDNIFYTSNIVQQMTLEGRIYAALLFLFSPNGVYQKKEIKDIFLNTLIEKNNSSNTATLNTQSAKVGVIAQAKLLYYCKIQKKTQAYKNLLKNSYIIISELLCYIANNPKKGNRIDWLLIKSYEEVQKDNDRLAEQTWKVLLKEYADELTKMLTEHFAIPRKLKGNNAGEPIFEKTTKPDTFGQRILDDLEKWEKSQTEQIQQDQLLSYDLKEGLATQPNLQKEFSKYDRIAKLFEEIRAYNLAAFFYQLSFGFVPDNITDNFSGFYEIIPLKKNPEMEENNNNSNLGNLNLFNRFLSSPYSKMIRNVFLGLILLGIGTGGGILINRFFFSPSFTVEESDPFPHKLYYYRKLSQAGIPERDTASIQSSLIQDVSKINDLNSGVPQINSFPKDQKDAKKAKQLQTDFIEKRKANLKKLLAYDYIVSLTPKIDQTLSQEILAEMTAAKASAKNTAEKPDVAENVKKVSVSIQPILRSLSFYKPETLTKTWDISTSEAVKNFQAYYQLTATGNLDQATWDILYIMIKDKQVQETATVLQSIFKSSQNSTELEEKMTGLEKCKNYPLNYLDCITQFKLQPPR